MDKRLIQAVAGAGKTTELVSRLDLKKRVLIVTYADNNVETIRSKVVDRFGFMPANVTVYSYFTFLHSFCYRPFLLLEMGRTVGLNFKEPPEFTYTLTRTNYKYYVDSHKRLYHGRLSKLLDVKGVIPDILKRLEKYFDALFIDEVQDFGGQDFEFLKSLMQAKMELMFVGDFFQSTYQTSRDGTLNNGLHKDFKKYLAYFLKGQMQVDREKLVKSRRCSPSVCGFIRDNIGIEIHSHSEESTVVEYIRDQQKANDIFACQKTVKLFYDKHYLYDCFSQNWGASKGQDHYNDVCVVLNLTTDAAYLKGDLRNLKPLTKNKFYVACSRARGNLYFVPDKMFKHFKALEK